MSPPYPHCGTTPILRRREDLSHQTLCANPTSNYIIGVARNLSWRGHSSWGDGAFLSPESCTLKPPKQGLGRKWGKLAQFTVKNVFWGHLNCWGRILPLSVPRATLMQTLARLLPPPQKKRQVISPIHTADADATQLDSCVASASAVCIVLGIIFIIESYRKHRKNSKIIVGYLSRL